MAISLTPQRFNSIIIVWRFLIWRMYMKLRQIIISLSFCTILTIPSAFAARAIDVAEIEPSTLTPFFTNNDTINMKLLNQHIDFNGTKHIRFQESYNGYAVWGGDIVVHIKDPAIAMNNFSIASLMDPLTSMNGVIYTNLKGDLIDTMTLAMQDSQLDKALSIAHNNSFRKHLQAESNNNYLDEEKLRIIYVDKMNKAHWAFKLAYTIKPKEGIPIRPTFVIDAITMDIYEQWDDIQTALSQVKGGGFGGNPRMGQIIYDGGAKHYAALDVSRDNLNKTCYMQNLISKVINLRTGSVTQYACPTMDSTHNNTYWDGDLDHANGGYSPSNDALFGIDMLERLYLSWYQVPVLTQNGKPMFLVGRVHEHIDNAYWDGRQMTFGDGVRYFYPLTSLDVVGHEISHGFTQQHSNLIYRGQSGGLNESYSDMAGEATEFYAYGKNDWLVGGGIIKNCGNPNLCALRYFSNPRLDGRSIDNVNQYRDGIDVHYSSGIYNKAFYLLANTQGWNTHKAFDVMVKANMDYWTSNVTFQAAGCGVVYAAKDYKYDVEAVRKSLARVGVVTTDCK